MAIDFTDNPSNGATITVAGRTYTYDSTTEVWDITSSSSGGGGGGVTTYANIAALPSSGNTGGDLAFVTDVKAFYGWDGTEWDRIFSGKNTLPEFTTSPAASYSLAADGTATTVTVAATDPEGFDVSYSHDTSPSNQAQATITQSGGTFTVTPSTNSSNAGTFTARFKAFDGVRTNSASSTFLLSFYEYVNWTTTNSYSTSGSGWQLNNNGNNIEVYNDGNLGTLSATHTTYTVADNQSTIPVYYEFTTNSSQGEYAAGFISTSKTNSDNNLRDVTTVGSYPGHYGGEYSSTGGDTYSLMLDRNTKKVHYWKNGTYDSTRSRVMANGTYYAAIGDGSSTNAASSSTKSIIRGVNSNGIATFTYNPETLYDTNVKDNLAVVSQHGTSWANSGAVAESGYSTTYNSSTLTYTGSGTSTNFKAFSPEHNFLTTSNWTDATTDRIFIKLYFSGVGGNLSNRKAAGFCFDYTETGNNLDDPAESALDNYIAIRGDNNATANSSVDESGSQGWTTYYRPGTFDAFYAGLYFNKRSGYSAFYWSSSENGTYTKWADKTFSTIPTGIYAWAWRRTAGQNVSVKLVDATLFTDVI